MDENSGLLNGYKTRIAKMGISHSKVAQHMGISRHLLSLVLNGHQRLTDKRRGQIEKALEELTVAETVADRARTAVLAGFREERGG